MQTRPAPDRPGRLNRFQRRTREIGRLKVARHLTQAAVAVLVLVAAAAHQVLQGAGAASLDALCPFGAVETLISWVGTGTLITRTHPSNLVLGLAVLVGTLLMGNAFCGWICPLGAVQDALSRLRRTLRLPTLTVPRPLDALLRWGRFVVLAVVLFFSVTSGTLWFAGYDPYLALFGLHWIFGMDGSSGWAALTILGVVLAGALVVDRLWCRYLCPMGAVFAVLSRFSLTRLRRSEDACTDCTLCNKACPVGIEPSRARPFVSGDCIGCLECVPTCPIPGALRLDAPVVLGLPVRGAPTDRAARPQRPSSHPVKEVR